MNWTPKELRPEQQRLKGMYFKFQNHFAKLWATPVTRNRINCDTKQENTK